MKNKFFLLVLALAFLSNATITNASVIPSPPGSFDSTANTVLIVHSNSTTTEYAATADTNLARGTAFKNALAASVAGDTIFLPAKVFDVGDNNFLQVVADTNWVGSGKDTTIIKSFGTIANPGNNVVNLANDFLIANLAIQATGGENVIQVPVGVRASNPDVNGVFFNVKIIGVNDGLYFTDAGGTVNIVGFNMYIYSKWDAIYLFDYNRSISLSLIDSNVEAIGLHSQSNGGVDGIILRSKTSAKFYNSSIVARNGGQDAGEEGGSTKGVYNLGSGTGTISLYNTVVEGTSIYSNQPIYSIYNSNGITRVDPLTVYSTGTTSGTITSIAADTQINSSWDGNAGTWQAHDANVHLACTKSTGACDLIYYRLDTNNSSASSFGEWTLYDQNVLITQDGNWAIAFNGSDLNGTSQDSNTQYALVDKTDSAVSWDGNNNTWQNFDANIHLTCTDSTSGCATTRYRLDTDSNIGVSYGNWQTYDSNILISRDGNWAIDFNATDTAGNASDTNTFYVLIDQTLPTVTITSPVNGSSQTSTTVTLEYTGSDSNSGIAKFYVKVDDANWIDNGTNTSYQFTAQSTGGRTYTVKATDNADNNSLDANAAITISLPQQQNNAGGSYIYCSYYPNSDACDMNEVCPGTLYNANDTPRCCSTACTLITDVDSETGSLEEPALLVTQSYSGNDSPTGLIQLPFVQALLLSGSQIASCIENVRQVHANPIKGADDQITNYAILVDLKLTNSCGGQVMYSIRVVEEIPKELLLDATDIQNQASFEIVKADPIISFFVGDVKPGESKTIQYRFNLAKATLLAQQELGQWNAPLLLFEVKNAFSCSDVVCDDLNPCTTNSCANAQCVFTKKQDGSICPNGTCRDGTCASNHENVEVTLPDETGANNPWFLALGALILLGIMLGILIAGKKDKKAG